MITELKRFIAIVDENNLTRASKKLFVTRPTLTISVARLEKELGVKLFRNEGKKLIITKDGKGVYTIASRIITLWDHAKNMSKNDKDHRIHIGVFDNAALLLSKYFKKHLSSDNLQFEITIDKSSFLLTGIQNGIFDIVVCTIPFEKAAPQNIALHYSFSEELIPVSRKIWKQKIEKIPFILYNKSSVTRQYVDDVFFTHSIKPTIIVESTDPMFMKELALSGAGVALLPKNIVEKELKVKKLFAQKFPFTFKRNIGIFLNSDSNINLPDSLLNKLLDTFHLNDIN